MSRDESGLPADRLLQPTTAKWFVAVFGVALAYAILRYHIAGDVAWRHFPLFIMNKVVALAAVGFVACSYLIGKVFRFHDHDKALRLVVIKFCGLMGFFLACVHAFMSVILLTPAYFGKYFDDTGRLNLQGELGMAVGIVALLFLLSPAITTLPMMPAAKTKGITNRARSPWPWPASRTVNTPKYVAPTARPRLIQNQMEAPSHSGSGTRGAKIRPMNGGYLVTVFVTSYST